jgi:galactokinase
MRHLTVSAPGRICLFGEHQDYLGLPVIAAAISLRIRAATLGPNDGRFSIHLPDVGGHEELDPCAEQSYAHSRDYLRSSLNVLRRQGAAWREGAEVRISGEIPIGAGVSSSSALTVMWLLYLCRSSEPPMDVSEDDLARLGYAAEVTEFGEPGGMMDHYCAALGGLIFIDTRPPFAARRLQAPLDGFVLGNSREPKATVETLGRVRAEVSEGVRELRGNLPTFHLAETPLEEAEPYLRRISPRLARRVRANLVNRDLTREALRRLEDGDGEAIGPLLLEHHAQLRDGLELSTPKIERMLEASLAAGALGGKINGSGGGGCMFAFAPGHALEAAEAIRRAGGEAYVVQIDRGAIVERMVE